jgi:hypothetical protein
MREEVDLSILGKQPCAHFAVQYWINEQLNKVRKRHSVDITKTHLQVLVDPARHFVHLRLCIEAENATTHIETNKEWKIDYDETEKFYREIEKREKISYRKTRKSIKVKP